MALFFLFAIPFVAFAGEGGTAHVVPGANATLIDLVPTKPGGFIKPLFIDYQGEASIRVPTAAGIVSNADANVQTLAIGGGFTFEQTVLGGAHYSIAAFQPFASMDITANSEALGGIQVQSDVEGLGDLTVVPVMLGWKDAELQYSFLMPVYVAIGSYQVGRLGNPGLNYWTIDPTGGIAYSNAKSGFNALAQLGYAINSSNDDTDYHSGNVLHLDAAVQQILPVGSGMLTLGAEAFWFEQISGDSGAGAHLGDFKGRTAGLGPVLGYILPMGKNALVFEAKWLPELEVRNRMEGDYVWLKAVYKF